ncbi:DUF5694 domain-containing protein [Janthinobacterium lividum]|uniref:DUF5694 domain-containing protein n=1 Tax=Janthinobacterium lividum TaxID=29581 RepID=A0ABU0XZE3_9BURK|nr:DUF5694 domain-containing protein [Janthinobacterium lividum]MDQ4628209.1 DUF5694 domain-containing protein [Janthinobacterium lividum]MDQ4675902.1 DUF5694 domain-containing protein [Janthinobacterium lividum]MDQ4687167.1 DUF5694 domain-containing protein [Janthinobacterium lividum]
MHRVFASFFLAVVMHVPAHAEAPPVAKFDPGALKLQKGPFNDVLVLGSPHLAQLPKSFDPSQLSLLNERLADWRPDAIAIEALSGLQCAYLRAYPQRYGDTVKAYCYDTSAARAATGLDVVAATAQAEGLLAAWPAAPSAAQRRTLASLFLAGGERASALVQWLRLPADERRAGDGVSEPLAANLNSLLMQRNESYQIAAVLAAKSGHERVHGMDDHTSDMPVDDEKAYAKAIRAAWNNSFSAERKRIHAGFEEQLTTPAGVLAIYRAYNGRAEADLAFRGDFGAALEEPSPQRYGRNYVASWEVRNLRMASNIREIMAARPGMHVLVIVGASHKGYLEAYLNQMHDVRITSTDDILR